MKKTYKVRRIDKDGKICLVDVPTAAIEVVLELGDRYIAKDIMKVLERDLGVKLTRNNVIGIKKKYKIKFSEKSKWYVTIKKRNKLDLERYYLTDEQIEIIKRDAEGVRATKAVKVFWEPWGVELRDYFSHLRLLDRVGIEPAIPEAERVYKPHTIRKIGESWFYINENRKKQRLGRYLYEWYNNTVLSDDDVIVFANGDHEDFDRYNLLRMSKKESMQMFMRKKITSSKELTKVNHTILQLDLKIKDLENRKKS